MILPSPVFTDFIPIKAGSGALAGAGTLAVTASVIQPAGTITLAGVGGLTASGSGGAGVAQGSAVLAGTGLLQVDATIERIVFGSATLTGVSGGSAACIFPAIYVIADDFMPDGGFELAGTATVTEYLPFVASGGFVYGGAATVRENIPFVASGGFVYGGAAALRITAAHVPTGGFVWSGAATLSVRYSVDIPSGGLSWAGTAPVSTYSAWHQPTGGFEWGGSATAYAATAAYTATTENPLSQPFYGWTLNPDNGAVTRYLRLPANSMAQLGGKTYVANAGGIYEVGGDSDAGEDIRASVRLPKTDFQTALSKRMAQAYFGLRSTGRMRLKIWVNEDDPRYYLLQPSGDNVKGTRVLIGKGLRGRYWAMRLDNVAGGDFELESAELMPVRSEHRHGA